jgi:hypothetical protein
MVAEARLYFRYNRATVMTFFEADHPPQACCRSGHLQALSTPFIPARLLALWSRIFTGPPSYLHRSNSRISAILPRVKSRGFSRRFFSRRALRVFSYAGSCCLFASYGSGLGLHWKLFMELHHPRLPVYSNLKRGACLTR